MKNSTKTLSSLSLDIVRTRLTAVDMTISKKGAEYRVNFKGGDEATAYYAMDLDDALATGQNMAQRRNVTPVQRATLVGAVNRARVELLDAVDALKQCMHEVDAALCIAIGVVVRKNADASARLHLARTLTSIIVNADSTSHTLTHQRDAVRFALDAARRVGDYAVADALTRVVATFDDCIAMQHNRDEAHRVASAARDAAQAAGVR